MNTDNSEAMRLIEACKHGWLENVDPDKCSLEDLLTLLRQQAECIAERDLLRAEVIANRERDALKLAALHIHSEMRSIVQAGGSNEAIGREFRKRVILDVEDEVVKLRAEAERLKPNAERYEWLRDNPDGAWAICEDNSDGLGYYRDARLPSIVDAAIDLARTTHKETE